MHNSTITPRSIKKSVVMFFGEKFVVVVVECTRRRGPPAVVRKPAPIDLVPTSTSKSNKTAAAAAWADALVCRVSRQRREGHSSGARSSITATALEQFPRSTDQRQPGRRRPKHKASEERETISTHVDSTASTDRPTKTELAVEEQYGMKVDAETTTTRRQYASNTSVNWRLRRCGVVRTGRRRHRLLISRRWNCTAAEVLRIASCVVSLIIAHDDYQMK